MKPLYEIANEYQQIFDSMDNEELISENILIKLDEVHEAMENKAIALASYIKNIEAEKKAINDAKKAMNEREERLNSKILSLQTYLQSNMERCGITDITKSPYFTIKLKKCRASVDDFDKEKIPDEYKRIKEIITIDKIKIYAELKNGVVIPGVRLVQNKRLEIN